MDFTLFCVGGCPQGQRVTVYPEWLSRNFGLVQATELGNGSNERFFSRKSSFPGEKNPKLGFAPRAFGRNVCTLTCKTIL